MPADLSVDTAVEALGGGRYGARLPDHWDYLLPSGGVLMTLGLRAIAAELPELRPISATTTFCAPVPPGPVEIDVITLRQGNIAAQARAVVRVAGQPGPSLEVASTFARPKGGPAFVNAIRPPWGVPEPGPDGEYERAARRYRFFQNLESRRPTRRVEGAEPLPEGIPSASAWFRYLVPQRTAQGLFDPLALPPLADTMPPAVRTRVASWDFHAPSLDLTVHFLDESRSDWVLSLAHSRWARDGYASATIELWGEDGALMAFGTQTMILRRR